MKKSELEKWAEAYCTEDGLINVDKYHYCMRGAKEVLKMVDAEKENLKRIFGDKRECNLVSIEYLKYLVEGEADE